MILSYSAENFYSLREHVTVDFTIGSQAKGRAGVFQSEGEQNVNSVIGVFGANASGKTNLLKPLGFLSWFILDSARSKPGAAVLYEPFAFTAETDKSTKLQLEFEFKGSLYRYELELADQQVVREALFRKKTRFSYLFERELDRETGEYAFKAQDLGAVASVPQRENASWLSSALLQAQPFVLELRPFFESIDGNLGPNGRLPIHDAEITNVFEAAGFYLDAPGTLEHVSSLLSEFDLGLSSVEIRQHKLMGADGKEQEAAFPYAVHEIGGGSYVRHLMQESRGTQALFVLLRYLLPVLENGGIAFIDEFESGLHPHMVRRIIELFFNPSTNPKQAQLIATFHTDFLLRDTLHKYQIYFAEKDEDLVTDAYRLDSIKGVRNVDNIYDKYHAGAYGGIPCLP
jgi:AAA15 family ATPase/GTPase